ncbi:MAG: hypothetical protein HQ478_04780 [Chloroflexi bacterium]|nr:hypothetical protein [Chloroflexota bacterium]
MVSPIFDPAVRIPVAMMVIAGLSAVVIGCTGDDTLVKRVEVNKTFEDHEISLTLRSVEFHTDETRAKFTIQNKSATSVDVIDNSQLAEQSGEIVSGGYFNERYRSYYRDRLITYVGKDITDTGNIFFPPLDPDRPLTITVAPCIRCNDSARAGDVFGPFVFDIP